MVYAIIVVRVDSEVIVIPWVVRLHVEIIHKLWRVDYLTYRWTNMVNLFYTTYICVDLAHDEIFRAKLVRVV